MFTSLHRQNKLLYFLSCIAVILNKCSNNVGLKSLLEEGLSKSEFYGDFVYKIRNSVGKTDFSF